MNELNLERPRPAAVGRRFYLVMSFAMAAVIVGGFAQTVPDDFSQRPGLPFLLHVHGAVFTLWVMLFVAQPAFIACGSRALHYKIGVAGACLAAAMLIMGVAATLYAVRYHMIPSFFPARIFLIMNLIGILTFAGLVAAGIAWRKRSEWHKRLMLCATISILGPGLGRLLPMAAFGAAAPLVMFAVITLFASAGPIFDLVTLGKIHPAYHWGGGAILLSMVSIPLLAFSPLAGTFVRMLQAA